MFIQNIVPTKNIGKKATSPRCDIVLVNEAKIVTGHLSLMRFY